MVFDDSQGRKIEVVYEESLARIVARHNDVRVGEISLCYRCPEPEICMPEHFYITHLDLRSDYCRLGIGTKMLEFLHSEFDLPVLAAEDDAIKREDGSHLIGDGPAFVSAMRRKGLIC
jgi:hypothetical protein